MCYNGMWTCTEKLCPKECSAVGDPHYLTFDGYEYAFMGTDCTYILVQDGCGPEAYVIHNIIPSGSSTKTVL